MKKLPLLLTGLCLIQDSLPLKAQVFVDLASSFNITEYNWDPTDFTPQQNFGAAVTTADWNSDGWPDITFGNASGQLKLYQNHEGNGFEAIDLPWIQSSRTKALIWCDIDLDGDKDLYIHESSGRSGLLMNANSSFQVIQLDDGIVPTENGGASMVDFDNDGDLDIFISRYADENQFPGNNLNVLLRNDGNAEFTDVSMQSGINTHARHSFGGAWWDINDDNLLDLYVINDFVPANELYINLGNGTFSEKTSQFGAELTGMDCMSLTIGDLDLDGDQDVFVTNTQVFGSQLLERLNANEFEEQSNQFGLNIHEWGWGAAWMDVDNDQDLDLFVAEHNLGVPYMPNHLYKNNLVSDSSTLQFSTFDTEVWAMDFLNSHVVATADFDRNGWIDFVVHNRGNHKARIWMNTGFDNGNQSVTIGLRGQVSNHDAAGAKIRVTTDSYTQEKIIFLGENYLSQESGYKVFGIGQDDVLNVEVQWPSGLLESFVPTQHGIGPGSFNILTEGTSLCPTPQVQLETCGFPFVADIDASNDAFNHLWISEEGDTLATGEQPIWQDGLSPMWELHMLYEGVDMCHVEYTTVHVPMAEDVDEDGIVAAQDLTILLSDLGNVGGAQSDIDADQSVTILDLLMLLSMFGQGCSTD